MSDPSVLIRSARLLDPATGGDRVADLGIRDGYIDAIGPDLDRTAYASTTDGAGHWLIPAAIDLAARFREPGSPQKAQFKTELRAAQAGGIGSVVLPPDSSPVLDTPAMADRIRGIAAAAGGGVHLHLIGALTQQLRGDALAEMSALRRAGCVAVGQGQAPLADSRIARRALEYAHGLGLTVHVVPQDAALADGGCAHDGPVATRLGLPPIPAAAESTMIRLWLSLVEDIRGPVHFGRLSTATGAELIATALQHGLPVSADVAVHQLILTESALEGFDAMAHLIPPLRSVADRDALRAAVRSGVIGSICSDHQPHEADAKINPFPLTEPGLSGLETLLPLTLRLVHEGVLSPLQAAERLSSGPARVLGLPAPALAIGAAADLVLIAPDEQWTLDPARFFSAGRNTPFAGQDFRGRVARTWHAGHEVFHADSTLR